MAEQRYTATLAVDVDGVPKYRLHIDIRCLWIRSTGERGPRAYLVHGTGCGCSDMSARLAEPAVQTGERWPSLQRAVDALRARAQHGTVMPFGRRKAARLLAEYERLQAELARLQSPTPEPAARDAAARVLQHRWALLADCSDSMSLGDAQQLVDVVLREVRKTEVARRP